MRDFAWCTQDQIDSFNPQNIPDDGDTGYVVECDLQYPEVLHAAHSDYPLAPERMTVPHEMLSEYSKALKEKLNLPLQSTPKLVPNLKNKTRYILHYRNLKLYQSLGMKITKIHRMVEFHQEAWLAPYIQLNTDMRQRAKNDFERDFFKLMNNSCFGKYTRPLHPNLTHILLTHLIQCITL